MHTMKYKIPDDLHCEKCTMQWYYATGNSCFYDGDYIDYFHKMKSLGWDAEPIVCEDESRHCLAGECVHPACTNTDGTKSSDNYPCTCLAGGPSPAPAPGPSGPSTCHDDSKNCKAGQCVDPQDNFADELVDQANVDFGMIDTNKDVCISDAEMTDVLRKQVASFKKGAAGERGYYWQEEQVQDGLKALTKEMDTRASDIESFDKRDGHT